MLLCIVAGAQEPNAPAKTKKVWTNENVGDIKGTINVVGQLNEKKPAGDADQPDTSPTAPNPRLGGAEACESDAWASGISTIVSAQGLPLNSKYWQERLFGGVCQTGVLMTTLSRGMDGDYVLDSGDKLKLKTFLATRSLPQAAEIVASVKENRPFIVVWKKRPLVANKVNYINHVINGVSVYMVEKLTLIDPASGRLVLMDVSKTPASEVDGALQVKVTKRSY